MLSSISRNVVLPCLVVLVSAAVAGADIIPVTVESGLAGALSDAVAGDELVLACGTYHEQGLDVVAGVTIRSDSGEAGCVELVSDGTEPILYLRDLGATTRLQGLVLRAEVAEGGLVTECGGALLCEAASPLVQDCEFRDLQAVYGAAVFCRTESSPELIGCRFTDNSAVAIGGALACVDASMPTLNDCLLARNSAGSTGGAIHAAAGSRPALTGCTLAQNSSAHGAALSGWDLSQSSQTRVIWAEQDGAEAWLGDDLSVPTLACSDLYANGGGDWTGALAPQAEAGGNLSADPLFCGAAAYTLDETSPCIEAGSGCGGIGAFDVGCANGSGVEQELPQFSNLNSVSPNPFNPRTRISFDVARDSHVGIEVYDLAGRLIRRLLDETMTRGTHELFWSGTDDESRSVAAGVYFVRLQTEDNVAVQRVTLVK